MSCAASYCCLCSRRIHGSADQPRIQYASQISDGVFWIEPELVNFTEPEQHRLQDHGKALTLRTGKKQTILRIEPIVDAEKEVKGYMAYTRP